MELKQVVEGNISKKISKQPQLLIHITMQKCRQHTMDWQFALQIQRHPQARDNNGHPHLLATYAEAEMTVYPRSDTTTGSAPGTMVCCGCGHHLPAGHNLQPPTLPPYLDVLPESSETPTFRYMTTIQSNV